MMLPPCKTALAPPQQYSRLLEGAVDISFGLPGYTGQLFPVTNTIAVPGLAKDAIDGTERLLKARKLIERYTQRPDTHRLETQPLEGLLEF